MSNVNSGDSFIMGFHSVLGGACLCNIEGKTENEK